MTNCVLLPSGVSSKRRKATVMPWVLTAEPSGVAILIAASGL